MTGNWTHIFFPTLTKTVTRVFYNLVSYFDRDVHLTFMNYGYIDLPGEHKYLDLTPAEEKHRYQVRLYHRIASAVDWSGKAALEIGSGRGGGAAFVMRNLKPKSLTGIDFSEKAIRFCKKYYSHIEGLEFVHGDAESLDFPDGSFDIVLNVESSLYYPNVPAFLQSVFRVLKPDGDFLYADIRYFEELPAWRQQIRRAGFEFVSEEDITQNTRTALALDQEHRRILIDKYVPKFLHPPFNKFAGTKARLSQGVPKPGERVYMNFVLKKPAS
jgi:ubiquinone/menaquinone biosynthesis C-methylase UbiE